MVEYSRLVRAAGEISANWKRAASGDMRLVIGLTGRARRHNGVAIFAVTCERFRQCRSDFGPAIADTALMKRPYTHGRSKPPPALRAPLGPRG
jgi:hypothetical protein